MLRPRIIPCLLVKDGTLLKTVEFGPGKYLGDPLNAARIFNEKAVDELVVFDIGATTDQREPNYPLIEELATECRMPLCYGGGVKAAEQVEKIVGLGVEKVAISSGVVDCPGLIKDASRRVGAQSVVTVMDVRRTSEADGEVFSHNGTRSTGLSPTEFASLAEEQGAGEIVVNSISRDGCMCGYDIELVRKVREATSLPITALGGAGSLQHIEDLIKALGIIGAAAGSLFVFKGPYRAVLLNYPSETEKDKLLSRARTQIQNSSDRPSV